MQNYINFRYFGIYIYKNILKIFGVRTLYADPDTIYGIKCKTSNYTLTEHCKELLLAYEAHAEFIGLLELGRAHILAGEDE